VTATLVAFHVAANAESFATTSMRALERFLASMAVAMDSQAAWAGERFIACWADIAILRLRKCSLARSTNVVMMLPGVGTIW